MYKCALRDGLNIFAFYCTVALSNFRDNGMSEYLKKIEALRAKQRELFEKELELVENRKKEIVSLIEKMGLITASDAMLAAALSPLLRAIETDDKATLTLLEEQGEKILHGNYRRKIEKNSGTTKTIGETSAATDNAGA
jgi:hypothetical protein